MRTIIYWYEFRRENECIERTSCAGDIDIFPKIPDYIMNFRNVSMYRDSSAADETMKDFLSLILSVLVDEWIDVMRSFRTAVN